MFHKYLPFVPAICLAALNSCATIINGSSQDVPIDVPQGTRVTTTGGTMVPVLYKTGLRDSGTYLRLERDEDYHLIFSYRGQNLTTRMVSHFDAAWLVLDFVGVYGLIVDPITGAWNSFDGIAVHFTPDTIGPSPTYPYVEGFDPMMRKKKGFLIQAQTGFALPMGNGEIDFAFFNYYGFACGYELSEELAMMVEFERGDRVNILSHNTHFTTFGSFQSFNALGRFKFYDRIYLNAGAGLAHIQSDSIKSGYYETETSAYSYEAYPPTDKTMPTLFVGLGVAGSLGFCEIRHTFGLSTFSVSTGEKGHYETTSLRFGFNFKF